MYQYILLVGAIVNAQASMYSMPDMKTDRFLNDLLLRDLLDLFGSELPDGSNPYLDSRESGAGIRGLSDKEIPLDIPNDYENIDALSPKTSIRDQEYLQHSSLWSHQQLNNYKTNDRHRIKPGTLGKAVAAAAAAAAANKNEKEQNQLPAYCTPPNPCPVGYTSENNCIVNFENTAAFSHDYQSAQDCMCDSDHMFGCPKASDVDNSVVPGMPITSADFDQIVERFQEENPFFRGEKLPIAAKKGINVGY